VWQSVKERELPHANVQVTTSTLPRVNTKQFMLIYMYFLFILSIDNISENWSEFVIISTWDRSVHILRFLVEIPNNQRSNNQRSNIPKFQNIQTKSIVVWWGEGGQKWKKRTDRSQVDIITNLDDEQNIGMLWLK